MLEDFLPLSPSVEPPGDSQKRLLLTVEIPTPVFNESEKVATVSELLVCNWDKLRRIIKKISLRKFWEKIDDPGLMDLKGRKYGSLFLPLLEPHFRTMYKGFISNETKSLLEPLLSRNERRITYLRKLPVNAMLFIMDKIGHLPVHLEERLTIIALPEGYVFGERVRKGNEIGLSLHTKISHFYPPQSNARKDSPISTNASEMSSEATRRQLHLITKEGETYIKIKLCPELESYLLELQNKGLKRIVYDQLKRLSAYPFIILLADSILLLEKVFEESKLDMGACRKCLRFVNLEKCVENMSLGKFKRVETCLSSNRFCCVSLIQAYRACMGHIRNKLEAYEKFRDYSWNHVELALNYYFLEIFFQLACALLPTSRRYKKMLIAKLTEYEKILRSIGDRIDFQELPIPSPEQFTISSENAKKFSADLSQLSTFLRTSLQTSTKLSPTNLYELFLKLCEGNPNFMRAYSRLVLLALNTRINGLSATPNNEIAQMNAIKDNSYSNILKSSKRRRYQYSFIVQAAVLEAIKTSPGLSRGQLKEQVGLNGKGLVDHLRRLIKDGLVVEKSVNLPKELGPGRRQTTSLYLTGRGERARFAHEKFFTDIIRTSRGN